MMMLAADIQRVYENLSKQEQEIFDRVVDLAYEVDKSFQQRMQWKVPTFTLHNNWHHWIFSLAKTKMGMTMTFHKGWLLDDPKKTLGGEGKHLRTLRFAAPNEIRSEILESLIRSAIQHQVDL